MRDLDRVLVTGAEGFVGSWLLAELSSNLPAGATVLATGHQVTARVTRALDVTDRSAVDDLVHDFRPTCVVHLAAISSLTRARAEGRETWNVNLFGTLNLAEAVLQHAPDARFLFASSSEVYGGSFNDVGGVADETTLLDPRNPYAATKAAADLMLGQMASAGLRSVRLRLFNHTGPGQSTAFAVPAFAAQVAAIERGLQPPVLKAGNVDARRDLLDVRDVVAAYRLVIAAPVLPNGIAINIASGVPRRIGDIIDALVDMSPVAIEVELDKALLRPTDVPLTMGDARRAKELLGWEPSIPWDTTLHDILSAHRAG